MKGEFKSPRRKPEAAAKILQQVFTQRHLQKEVSRYSGFSRWAELVGEDVAKVAEPIAIVRKNVLKVRVIDPVWAQELALRKPEIVEQLSSGALGSVIEDLQFVIEGPKRKTEP